MSIFLLPSLVFLEYRTRQRQHLSPMKNGILQIGLAGLGTVGAGVYETLIKNSDLLMARTQIPFEIVHVAVRDKVKLREVSLLSGVKLTDDWRDLVQDESLDIIIELMGGTTTAKELVCASLRARKSVVTGNKALLAEHGDEIFKLSQKMDTPLYFEAAVAGGIPIIDSMMESLVSNHFVTIAGIINGTSNYILERMTTAGLDYKVALQEAQDLGYAESDPTLDVNGWDAAHKALLLALIAYGTPVKPADIYVAGIEGVRSVDICFAEKLGYAVKLLAVIRQHEDNLIELRVQPSFVSRKHILSSVNGVFNALAVEGDIVGETLFYGRGAGKYPTSSAVISDVVKAARDMGECRKHNGFVPYSPDTRILPVAQTVTPYYVRFKVDDTNGVIASIATVLAKHEIGISGTNSMPRAGSDLQDLVFILHRCPFGDLQAALADIALLPGISPNPAVFRIEKFISE